MGVWLAVKAFAGPLLEGLWRVLTDWRVIVAVVTAVTLYLVHEDGRKGGLAEAKIERQGEIITAQAGRLTENDDAFKRLDARLKEIAGDIMRRADADKARAAALEAFKQEMLNAPDPRCLLTDRDVRLLDTLGGFAKAK